VLSEHEKIGIERLLGERRDHGEVANLAPLRLDACTFQGLFEYGTRPATPCIVNLHDAGGRVGTNRRWDRQCHKRRHDRIESQNIRALVLR